MKKEKFLQKNMQWGLVWLASYPKSGNTWFRIFMANYLNNKNNPLNINNLSQNIEIQGAGNLKNIRQMYGINTSHLNFEEIEQYRSMMYDQWSSQKKNIFCKTHDAYTYLSNKKPLLGSPANQAAIYIIRNPLDVAVSYANHFIVSDNAVENLSHSIKKINSTNNLLNNNSVQMNDKFRIKLSSWSQHVISWQNTPLPILIIRYEDMLLDTLNTFCKAVRFLGFPHDLRRIQRAINFSSFDLLKKQEKKLGFNEKNPRAKNFFRLGKSLSYHKQLEKHQIQCIINTHQEVMRQFNYIENEF